MKQQAKRSRHAQNRIAYIIYSNPGKVRKLIDQHGYEPPKNVHDLVKATKQLVRRKGRRFVKELIKLHPDRKAILSVEKIREDSYCSACSSYSYDPEDNYCGSCGHSSYTGQDNKPEFLKQLVGMGLNELEELYENVVRKSNKDPKNPALSEEVRLVWNELRLRKKEGIEKPDKSLQQPITDTCSDGILVKPKEALIVLGLTLVAGGLIGSAWGFKQNAA
ncbi:hypothetical protein QQ008_07650 [Fulvivirgaceae bacterium BMA10]|uniref:Uncharacterized protein n=1 Tax=Splendidivirga corallicola TaxID=3051826 RepID=A0ABT8KKI7_9BACT|nr:hypothetical protein [Fulvivirgaceae bacterium BMA10]